MITKTEDNIHHNVRWREINKPTGLTKDHF